jgi:toxin-antitoxin system PIN domain toxin
MSVHLLDVNVLVALAWPSHAHHEAAHRWFSLENEKGFATCPITQCGFVRISANPRIISDAVSIEQAWNHLRMIAVHPHHVFWADDVDVSQDGLLPVSSMRSHREVTDVYLASLAFKRNGKLATFDQGIPRTLENSLLGASVTLIH